MFNPDLSYREMDDRKISKFLDIVHSIKKHSNSISKEFYNKHMESLYKESLKIILKDLTREEIEEIGFKLPVGIRITNPKEYLSATIYPSHDDIKKVAEELNIPYGGLYISSDNIYTLNAPPEFSERVDKVFEQIRKIGSNIERSNQISIRLQNLGYDPKTILSAVFPLYIIKEVFNSFVDTYIEDFKDLPSRKEALEDIKDQRILEELKEVHKSLVLLASLKEFQIMN